MKYSLFNDHLRYILKTEVICDRTKLYYNNSIHDVNIHSFIVKHNGVKYNVYLVDILYHRIDSIKKIAFANNAVFLVSDCTLSNDMLFHSYSRNDFVDLSNITRYFDKIALKCDLIFKDFDEQTFIFDYNDNGLRLTTNVIGNNYLELINFVNEYRRSVKFNNSIKIKLFDGKFLLFDDKYLVKSTHDGLLKFTRNSKVIKKLLSTLGGLYEYRAFK